MRQPVRCHGGTGRSIDGARGRRAVAVAAVDVKVDQIVW